MISQVTRNPTNNQEDEDRVNEFQKHLAENFVTLASFISTLDFKPNDIYMNGGSW